ncbi:hypothetical protein MGA3_04740 [Bacillus methanolicus MGA3]|nr:hypothetical protein MGA3_04740 [Bacillus methanolicus MGA3]
MATRTIRPYFLGTNGLFYFVSILIYFQFLLLKPAIWILKEEI